MKARLFKHLSPYLGRYRRPYVLGTLFIIASTICMICSPRLVQIALDSIKDGVDLDFLGGCALGIVGVILGRSAFLFFTRRFMIFASRHIENDIRNDFFRHLQVLPPAFFHANPTGDLMAVATNDLTAVRQVLGPGIMYSVSTLFSSVLILINLILINPWLTLMALAVLPFMALAVYRFGRSIHHRFEKIQEQFGAITSRTQESLSGVRVIRSYVQEEHEQLLFRKANREYVERNRGYVAIQSAFRPVLTAIMGLGTMILLLAGGEMIIREYITIGEFTAFSIYLTMLIWPAVAIGWVTGLFQRGAASMKRIQRVLDAVPEIRDEAAAGPLKGAEGRIEIRDLSFRYAPDGPFVLKRINTIIEPGEFVAIIGATGSGKTTLVSLLARLFPVERGRILIDGRDINDISLASLRSLYGFVTQETFLFSDTIRNNIAFAVPDAAQEAVLPSARLARIHEEIEEFPKGYETLLGERGINLSGGQKQRTAIARAMLKDPKVLVLDDALASVDTRTEGRILDNIREFVRGRTLILIAHRISTVRHADRILVLLDGEVAEEGSHERLVRKGGLYANLNEQQRLKSEIEEME